MEHKSLVFTLKIPGYENLVGLTMSPLSPTAEAKGANGRQLFTWSVSIQASIHTDPGPSGS